MKRFLVPVLAVALAGCSWVSLSPGADAVRVRDVDSLTGCTRLGKTHTRTKANVGFILRRKSAVEEELVSLARNEAVRMGGNVVSPVGPVHEGEQDFGIYRCN